MTSLDAYAASRGVTPIAARVCGVCSLPEEIREAMIENESRTSNRLPRHVVAAWASEESGTTVTVSMLEKHLVRH